MCHGKAQNVPRHGTKRLLELCAMAWEGTKCATGRHKMSHGTAQIDLCDLCAMERHKMFHSTAQKGF
jgi:hypothetical protein